MTRFLSEALQTQEPFFRLGLRHLESSNGNPSHDIRLTTTLNQHARQKTLELGLDPNDTTPRELYHMLQTRLQQDDERLTRSLQTRAATYISAEGDVVEGMIHALKDLPESRECFAIKGSVLKAVVTKIPPKKAMKAMGYRSVASFVKNESPASILAAAAVAEDASWQQKLFNSYKKLEAKDFETRQVTFLKADSAKWKDLADHFLQNKRHTMLSFKELGAVVFLPFSGKAPKGAVTASTIMALHSLNDIRSASTFLKLTQVRPNYGKLVQKVVADEARLNSQVLGRAVPWSMVQRYYHRFKDNFDEAIFEPHMQVEDLVVRPIEKALSSIEPSLHFWHGTNHLGVNDGGAPVSLNIADVALNFVNKLPYEQRLVEYFQNSLWHELLIKYLSPDQLNQTLTHELQPQFALAKG